MRVNNNLIVLENGEYEELYDNNEDVVYPEKLQRIILKIALDYLGIKYHNAMSLKDLFSLIPNEELDQVINTVSDLYYVPEKVDYSDKHLAYLLYYLPCNTHKIHRPLIDLIPRGLLKKDISILDIATGPGSMSLGAIEFYRMLAENFIHTQFSINISILDSDNKFLDIAEKLIGEVKKDLPPNLSVVLNRVINLDMELLFIIEESYDLIIMGNVLNPYEVAGSFDATVFTRNIIPLLKDSGSIIMVEPGNKENCLFFKDIRNKIVSNSGLNLFSPCSDIWGTKNVYECTCFSHGKVFWEMPFIIEQLRARGLVKNPEDVPFNYAILRKDGRVKYQPAKYIRAYTKLKDIHLYEGELVNVAGIVRGVIETDYYLFVSICDGTKSFSDNHVHIAIDRREKSIWASYYEMLKGMKLGQGIIAQNLYCEQMALYPDSYILEVQDDSSINGCY